MASNKLYISLFNLRSLFYIISKSLNTQFKRCLINCKWKIMASTQSLKTELFSSLSKQGFHDDIKKQVRIKLVEQLRDKKLIETKTETKQLFKRVLSSLIM